MVNNKTYRDLSDKVFTISSNNSKLVSDEELESHELLSTEIPNEFSLGQNYPNPFNPTTQITYQIPQDGHVSLIVYNPLGKKVKTLVNEFKSIGSYNVVFNAANLPSGIYFYKMQSGNFRKIKKMLLVK